MADNRFAKQLRQKRMEYQISQDRLSVVSGISCHYISDVETEKTIPTPQKQKQLLDALEKLNPDKPLTMLVDYVRIRFPSVDAGFVSENILQLGLDYMFHEDYGFYSYDEHYVMGDIFLLVSADERKGILLEMKGKGCRQFECYLAAQHRDWFMFFREALQAGGVMKRIDLAINDKSGILDIPELAGKCEQGECISVFRTFKSYRSGEFACSKAQEPDKDEMGTTLYIGSMHSDVYFCIYEKAYEQYVKFDVPLEEAPIKNRFEIRLKNERAALAVDDLLSYQNPERTAFSIINRYLRFVDKREGVPREQWETNRKWLLFIGENRESLRLTTEPEPYSMERTLNWLSHQVAPTLKTLMKIDEINGTDNIRKMIKAAVLQKRHEQLLEIVTIPIDKIITRGNTDGA